MTRPVNRENLPDSVGAESTDGAQVIGSPTGDETVRAPSERIRWWRDQKLGVLVTWGPWSQTEIGIVWHIVLHEPERRDSWFELHRTFDPGAFDPHEWARLLRAAGVRYAVFTAKHHDGFCNWDTGVTDFKITNPEVPYSRSPQPDIIRASLDAARDHGLGTGIYYSHIDWHHPDGRHFSRRHWDYDESLVESAPERWRRFVEFERAQVRELLTGYGPIDVMWFDLVWPMGEGWGPENRFRTSKHAQVRRDVADLVRMVRELVPTIIVNDRGTDRFADYVSPEQRVPETPPDLPWESAITLSDPYRREIGGFWYKGPDASYKSLDEVLRLMGEVFSKGGNLLLGIGPQPDGRLPPGEVALLGELASWMDVNAEAVHGTTASPLREQPDDGFVTAGDRRLYLWQFDGAQGRQVRLRVNARVESARVLGGESVAVEQRDGWTEFVLPDRLPHPVCSIVRLDVG